MARMVPFPMLPTDSAAERRLYEGFLEQLDETFVVYHSVDWVIAGRNGPDEGEADFVVAHPELGVLALEAKGGRLDYDPASRRWTQTGHSGTHRLDEDPFHQAQGAMHSLVRILEGRPGWDRWRPSYGFGLAIPDGRYKTPAHPAAPTEVVIDRDDLDHLDRAVRRVMSYWLRPGRRFGAEGMDELAEALGFRVEIRVPLKLRFDEEDRKIVELTDDQAWVLSFVVKRHRAAVTGPAGSGKTLLAIAVAKRLAAAGHRVLLTCFNKRLGEHLREAVAGIPHLEVAHFHQLCSQLAGEAGVALPAEPEAGPNSPYFERVLPDALATAADRLGPRFDAIVVDEGQDFREWWWPALLGLHTDPDEGLLYVFADDHQNLYGGELPIAEEDRIGPIPHNLRNTKQISEFVSVFYEGSEEPIARGPDGDPVEILGYEDDEGLAHLLAVVLTNLVEEEAVPLEDIAVLTPSGSGKSRLRARGSVNGFRLSEAVEPGTVLATSVHGFKGLERPVVILAELGDKHLDDLKQYLYVGGSRARNHLIVLAAEPVARELRRITGVTGP
ncbi:MAG TPA: ATP-binding domain-containing protein [Actinomycetota bacterium]|nr:ATP-binding domain-containing protein [Actinomycetota bacterium]